MERALRCRRGDPDSREPLRRRLGGADRGILELGKRPIFGRGDPLLRLGQLLGEPLVELSLARGCLRLQAALGLGEKPVRLVLSLGQTLLVGGQGRLRLAPEPLRLIEIGSYSILASLEDLADQRQRVTAEQIVQGGEADNQPEDLAGEGPNFQLWHVRSSSRSTGLR